MITRLQLKESEARYSMRVIKRPVDGAVVACLHGPVESVGENPVLTIDMLETLGNGFIFLHKYDTSKKSQQVIIKSLYFRNY